VEKQTGESSLFSGSAVLFWPEGSCSQSPRLPRAIHVSRLSDSAAPRWPCWLCWQLQLDGELQSDRIRKMAQRWGCAALALAQVRIRDRQELDFVGNCTCTYCTYTWLALVLYPYCTRTLCSCHATRYWSPPTKAAHSSSQPRASPDSCHPDTFQ
jgi:hypothetical protein